MITKKELIKEIKDTIKNFDSSISITSDPMVKANNRIAMSNLYIALSNLIKE